MKKGRIQYLDLVKLFTIYLVIMGHVIAMMVNGYTVGGRMYALIYSFHMPLFMMLSGYFISNKTLSKTVPDFLLTKARQLLLPAITCTAICLLYLFIVREHVDVRSEIIGNSWFLKTLFVFYVLFYLIKKIPMNDWILLIVSCGLLFVIPHATTLQVNLIFPYFWGGYLLRRFQVLEKVSFKWKYAVFFVAAFAGCYSLQRYLGVPNYIGINIDSLQSQWHFILLRYVVAFSGCLATITLLSVLYNYCSKRGNMIGEIAKYGQWTLGVYVLQTILVINIFPDTLAWYVESEWQLDLIVAPLLSLAFLVLCLLLIRWISKNKALGLIIFGGQYKTL